MTRDLTFATITAVLAEQVKRVVAVALEFDSATLFATSAPYDITIGADTYLGVGSLGSISAIAENPGLQAPGVTLAMAGIPRDMVTSALTEDYQNRPVTIYEVPLNLSTEAPIADPIVIFKGRMDTMTIALDGETATVEIQCTNRLADWERTSAILFSDEAQQRLHTGDLGFEFASGMETRRVVWPSGEWFKANM